MKMLSIRVPDDIQKALLTISRFEKKKVSDLVRTSLRTFVMAEQLKLIREKTVPYGEKLGLLTDEDVFEYLKS